jgi:hypothetical protein
MLIVQSAVPFMSASTTGSVLSSRLQTKLCRALIVSRQFIIVDMAD